MKRSILIPILLLSCTAALTGRANTPDSTQLALSAPLAETISTDAPALPADAPVISSDDTAPVALTSSPASESGKKPRFLPMKRRMDREINKIKFVYKGEIMCGLTASYGTIDSEDTNLWLLLDNLNLNGSIFTINPFVGYFFRDNICLGARFGYSQVSGHLGSAMLNLGEANDMDVSVSDIILKNKDVSFGLFLRSYAGLDSKGHFGLFGELELSMSSGDSEFSYMTGGEPRQTFGDNMKVKISFNPGMAVYIFPNVCGTISFGLGGFQYTKTTQKDAEGNKIGSRTQSNLRFRLNLAEIRIGLTIHMWNKKKAL